MGRGRRQRLLAEDGIDVALGVDDAVNDDVSFVDSVSDYVVSGRKRAEPGLKVVACAACHRVVGEKRKACEQEFNQRIGDGLAPALSGDIKPDLVEISLGGRSSNVSHQE